MGLDLSCGVSFSYGGFHEFRTMLVKELGFDLDKMEGFGGEIPFKEIKDDIKYLINHSDCDGQISAKRCGKVAPRLRELTKEWDNGDEDKKWYRKKALNLAEGMEECFKNNEPLYFY